jgi:uncharacterized protein
MNKTYLTTALILFSFCAIAQFENKIVIGTIDSINSKVLNEQRKFWVYVPDAGSNNIYENEKYPVVYLLDGDAHFFSVVGIIQQLSSINGNTVLPKMIVVGIPNTDRTRDLTPTHVATGNEFTDSAFVANSGGGEKFITFIEKELMPRIDSLYPTAPYRTLIGHSFGGLAVVHTLVHHPDLFNAYIAIDPSMWWDNKKLLNETRTAFTTKNFSCNSLFLAIANTMPAGIDTLLARTDTSVDTKHIRSILELNDCLSSKTNNELKFKSNYYKDDTHSSSPLISTYDALRFIFDFYSLKLSASDNKNFNQQVISKIETHYRDVSKSFGYKVNIPEDLANTLGYQCLNEKKFKEAEYLFKLNVANYPGSFNVYDSLGDLFDAIGDKTNAIANYKKALSIREFSDTRQKLEKLEKK